jgi:hypothetical protein
MALGAQGSDNQEAVREVRQAHVDERDIQTVSRVERVTRGCGDTDYAQAFGRREQLAQGGANPWVVLHDEHPTALAWP